MRVRVQEHGVGSQEEGVRVHEEGKAACLSGLLEQIAADTYVTRAGLYRKTPRPVRV
eukprot:CAMPEP_0173206122 /NCGR_PEP_ID=MMETSP1141-20130122/21154_1 /TAXON_ID=483371 /ORGANISM="non described non described, Strain CCMP2298" /LENGTH=56 /DNA_ID=CAMNT_0014132165 /DNA_START=205 /DNA_END=375 /DNA_ORIENTATION=-